jgi:hypothetical protein
LPEGYLGLADVSLVDSVRLTYPHKYRADLGALRFEAPDGRAQMTVAGFPDATVRVIDLTDPNAMFEVPVNPSCGGKSNCSAMFVTTDASGQGNRKLLAFTESRVLAPASVTTNQPSALNALKVKTGLVVISNGAFIKALDPLVKRRQADRLSVLNVNVEDVYDEFNYGEKSPYAIREFLASRVAAGGARYVLLVGDSTVDPRNYLGLGDVDFLPTKLIATRNLKTASDDWFVDFNEDRLPEAAVGRFAVRTTAEATTVVTKVLGYSDSIAAKEGWRGSVLHVADQNDDPSVNPLKFETAVADLTALVPAPYTVSSLLSGQLGADAAHQGIVEKTNQGQFLVTFIGHGAQDFWSSLRTTNGAPIFSGSDVSTLTNGAKLPIVFGMTCFTGLFEDWRVESFAETLQKAPNGGAVAVWASSGFSVPRPQVDLSRAAYSLLFSQSTKRLGDALTPAKASISDPDVRRTWILFGDPSMPIR